MRSASPSNFLPLFLGNTFFHLLLIDTVYTLGLMRSQAERTRRHRRGAGADPVGARGPRGRGYHEHKSWEPSPSVETHGSYGFGFFPQFSVGLAGPGTLISRLWSGRRAAAGPHAALGRGAWAPGAGVPPPGHPPEQRAQRPPAAEFAVCPPSSALQALGPLHTRSGCF